MCLECRVLGALAHHSVDGVQNLVHLFSKFDFRPLQSQVKEYLVDQSSTEYLKSTLSEIERLTSVQFQVIKVDSDGSCLPYAISRCLIGKEILYDVLRQSLYEELKHHEIYYKAIFQQSMNDETWAIHWDTILDESKPTRGMRSPKWLGPGEHLIGMANVLARPILLLDGNLSKFDGVSSGLFLPIRLTRTEILQRHDGIFPSPLVIAWANEKKNHFVALIRTCMTKDEEREVFLKEDFLSKGLSIAIERSCFKVEASSRLSDERNQLRGMEMPIQVPPSGPNEFVSLKDSETNEEIKIKVPPGVKPGSTFQAKFMRPPPPIERAWMKLLLENSATPRARCLQTLKLIIENLVDAYLGGDFAKVAKVSKLKLDNPMVKSNLIVCSGAHDFVKACGFKKSAEDNVIEFKAQFDERIIHIRDALRACVAEASSIRDVEGEIKAGMEPKIFGPKPACYTPKEKVNDSEIWESAREQYGFDGPDTSSKAASASRMNAGVWIFNAAGILREADREKAVEVFMSRLHKDFETVSKNSELDKVDWDDVIMYNKRLMHVRCPECEQDQEWTGPVDGLNAELHSQACSKCSKALKAEMTGARKLLSFVGACAVDGELGSTRCSKCSSLSLGKNEKCTFCEA
jgi:hypothetical protein